MSDSSLTRLVPARLRLPEKPALEGLEAKWTPQWEDAGVYRFDRTRPRADVFAIHTPPGQPGKQPISVARPNFIELCMRLTVEDEKVFEHLWKYLGLSVDWSMTYATISPRAQRVSQLAFLRLLKRNLAYQVEAPTLWDVDFKTAVAQAELEDRELAGAYHRIPFRKPDGGSVEIETTRPELIPA